MARTSKPKAPTQLRADVKELKKMIRDGVEGIKAAKEERSAQNSDISAIIENLEAKGIGRHALKAAMKYAEWDEDVRAGFDVAYALVRETLGVPFEDQLFDAQGQPRLVVPASSKTKAGPEDEEKSKDEPELPLDDGEAPETEGEPESEAVKEPESAPAAAALH